MTPARIAEIERRLDGLAAGSFVVVSTLEARELLTALKASLERLAAKDESYRELFESNQELGAALVKVGAQVAKLREAFAAQARALLKETADGE